MTHAPRDVSIYFADILKAIKNIEMYTDGMTFKNFRSDPKTIDAVVRNLEIIGEATKRIPDNVRNQHPTVAWRAAAAMRDFLIHEYPEVDAEAVWDTITTDLLPFKTAIKEIVDGKQGKFA